MRRAVLSSSLASLLFLAAAAHAGVTCKPCAALLVDDPARAAAALSELPALEEDAALYVAWSEDLDSPDGAGAAAVRARGALPWLRVVFRTPSPLLQNLQQLERELAGLAVLAEHSGPQARFQLSWENQSEVPEGSSEYAFLIKRAAVAISGAEPDASVVLGPLPADGEGLNALYSEDLAAYLDGVSFEPAPQETLRALYLVLQDLDPGAELIVEGLVMPAEPSEVLVEAARYAEAEAANTLFQVEEPQAATLAPFRFLAAEFRGDLALDPYSTPSGGADAWSFVRGEDLGLRVIVRTPPGASAVRLEFPDGQLREPRRLDPATGESASLYGLGTRSGYEIEIQDPPPVMVLALERVSAAELEGMLGLEEEVTVADVRQIPVGEILRRLQAFEDAQRRALRHYRAVNTTHLRFNLGTGAGAFEATFRGDFFFEQGGQFDWAWKELYLNGVRWRDRRVPEIPLIQPEKAAAMPVEITFTREYRYSLRGTDTVDGRDCWVVDFEPAVEVEEGRTLYQGTVWVDRATYARVRTRAVQLGLKGQVLSNEETTSFSPLDAAGEPGPWSPESYFLPTRLVGQQIWSVLSATTVVEREILLSEVTINGEGFAAERQAVLDSDVTMVRDTEEGMRYLVADKETGERVVQEELDPKRRFLVGGVFQDESQDFPIPLAGINWLWFDWRGTGTQANVFFAGALFNVAVTDPDFLGSKWDAGFDVFGLALAGSDTLYRGGREVDEEEVEFIRPNIDFKLGRPIGSFAKVEARYELGYLNFSRADDTAAGFVLPSDTLTHEFSLTGRYNRAGYRFRLGGSHTVRGEWEPWGFAGNPDYAPDKDEYQKWEVGLGKTWHLPKFMKVGAEVEYVDGSNLDRFSRYEFGFFSDIRVHGYQSDKVRAQEALAAHLTYGFDVGSVFRLDLVGDAAWATDPATGLEDEMLAGVGVAGTIVGPWRTLINLDLGVAVDGPDDGVSAFLAVLKLFE